MTTGPGAIIVLLSALVYLGVGAGAIVAIVLVVRSLMRIASALDRIARSLENPPAR